MSTVTDSHRRAFVGYFLPGFLIAVMVIIIICIGLFSRSDYEDNVYNYAMVERSVLPNSHYILETSLAHVFYQRYQLPRAEDWHRGLSLILLKLWANIVDPSNETLMRIPHVIWVLIWCGLAVKLLWMLEENANLTSWSWKRLWSVFLLLCLVSFSQLLSVIQTGFMDDVPTAVCVLAIVFLLLRYKNNPAWLVLAVGILAGLAFWMKDFGLIWFPIVGGWLLINCLLLEHRKSSFKRAFLIGAIFLITYLVTISPKLIWNFSELHSLFGQPASYMNSTLFFGKGTHYPYFLYDDTTYQTRQNIANGLRLSITSVVHLFTDYATLWGLLLLPVLGFRLKLRWSRSHQQLFGFLVLSTVTFTVCFAIGLGEANILRYWLVQFTLLIALGIDGGWLLLEHLIGGIGEKGKSALRYVGVGVSLIALFVIVRFRAGSLVSTVQPLVTKQTANLIKTSLHDGEAVMLDRKSAFYYWSQEPASNVVDVFEQNWEYFITDDDLQRFVDAFNIRVAAYSSEKITNQLKAIGFKEIGHDGDLTVLERN